MTTLEQDKQPLFTRLWLRSLPLQLIVVMAMIGFMLGVIGSMSVLLLRGNFHVNTIIARPAAAPTVGPAIHVAALPANSISPIFTAEVQHWSAQIMNWSRQYQIDPNAIATVMQIESCGDPQAGSVVGAQGLFQVMPDHFGAGENPLDPDTNARAGIAYFKDGLEIAGGHVGLALAGYNGGHGVINIGWGNWAPETQRYYLWGTAIYLDALQSHPSSASLQDWLNAGGVNLCRQAAARLAPAPTLEVTLQPPVG